MSGVGCENDCATVAYALGAALLDADEEENRVEIVCLLMFMFLLMLVR
jgi:hypothetical protein